MSKVTLWERCQQLLVHNFDEDQVPKLLWSQIQPKTSFSIRNEHDDVMQIWNWSALSRKNSSCFKSVIPSCVPSVV